MSEHTESNRNDVLNNADINPEEVYQFCASVEKWYVAAKKRDGLFDVYKENPQFLLGYLAYITQKNIQETSKLQRVTGILTTNTFLIAIGSLFVALFSQIDIFFPTCYPSIYLSLVIADIILVTLILVVMLFVVEKLWQNR